LRFFSFSTSSKINLFIANLCLISLIISILSGMVVSYHYFYTEPLYSVIRLESSVPFGRFFRSLHYFSSQLALISTFFHLIDSLYKGWHHKKNFVAWLFLVLSFIVLIFITFTGYVIRFDEVGKLAGTIAENLCLSIPYVGEVLRDLLFPISKGGLYRVYLAHIYGSFLLAIGLFVWHASIKRVLSLKYAPYLYLNLILPLIFYVPLESEKGKTIVTGPWFFWGAQGLLKFLPPLGVLFLLFLAVVWLVLLGFKPARKFSLWIVGALIWWLLVYVIFSLIIYRDAHT